MTRPNQPVVELDPSFYDQPDTDPSGLDLDAWWASQTGHRETATICGVTVPVPSEVPAQMALQPDKLLALDVDGDNPDDLTTTVETLARIWDLAGVDGTALVDELVAAGIGAQQLGLTFAWALINGMRPLGKPPVSFARVAGVVREPGKPQAADQRAARARVERATAARSTPQRRGRATPGRR